MSIHVDSDTNLDKENGCVLYSLSMAHLALRCQHTTEDEKMTPWRGFSWQNRGWWSYEGHSILGAPHLFAWLFFVSLTI